MNISEKQLREAIIRAILKVEAEQKLQAETERQKVYMVCSEAWDERYSAFMRSFNPSAPVSLVPVIPRGWRQDESRFTKEKLCPGCLAADAGIPEDLGTAVTVFPVVPRDVIVKTALCLSDTFETGWIAACLKAGGQIVFLTTGMEPFSGKEPGPYRDRILSYCRTVLEYGIDITKEFDLRKYIEKHSEKYTNLPAGGREGGAMDQRAAGTDRYRDKKRAVISSKDVERLQRGGILTVNPDDIITDLARDRARFLNVTIRTAGDRPVPF